MSLDEKQFLPLSFYENPDVTDAARQLLGKVLVSSLGSERTAGIITETEAYCGRNDKACHANNGLRTSRTEVMYGRPGRAYIYLCYGIHHLMNVVTNREGLADAVLIRGLKPLEGIKLMRERRQIKKDKNLANGPGKLSQALSITTDLNATSLRQPPLWIEDRGIEIPEKFVEATPRIGVDYAGEHAKRPWRYIVNGGVSSI
jgi:DNA-3-methyladenine glycosylase